MDRIDKEIERYGKEVGRVLDKLDDLVGPEPRQRTAKTTKRAAKARPKSRSRKRA